MTHKSRERRGALALDRTEQRRLLRQQRKVKDNRERHLKWLARKRSAPPALVASQRQ